jgi:hypothetical protein
VEGLKARATSIEAGEGLREFLHNAATDDGYAKTSALYRRFDKTSTRSPRA